MLDTLVQIKSIIKINLTISFYLYFFFNVVTGEFKIICAFIKFLLGNVAIDFVALGEVF